MLPSPRRRRVSGRRRLTATGLLPARLAMPWPPVTIGYHVYDVGVGRCCSGSAAQAGSPAPALPKRLTAAPLTATTFSDTRVEYGVERCYVVRTVETIGTLTVESAGSAPACVKPTDVFPPAAPQVTGGGGERGRDQPDLGRQRRAGPRRLHRAARRCAAVRRPSG